MPYLQLSRAKFVESLFLWSHSFLSFTPHIQNTSMSYWHCPQHITSLWPLLTSSTATILFPFCIISSMGFCFPFCFPTVCSQPSSQNNPCKTYAHKSYICQPSVQNPPAVPCCSQSKPPHVPDGRYGLTWYVPYYVSDFISLSSPPCSKPGILKTRDLQRLFPFTKSLSRG